MFFFFLIDVRVNETLVFWTKWGQTFSYHGKWIFMDELILKCYNG